MTTRTMDHAVQRPTLPRRSAHLRYWLAAVITVLGVVGGLALGVSSYRASQQDLDDLDRTPVPGAMTVVLAASTDRVIYYEGDDEVALDDLSITVTDPSGDDVAVRPYGGDLVYETADLTTGRAVAAIHTGEPGRYLIQVTGAEGGQLTVGESFARRALPGVLTGLSIAVLSVIAGTSLWLVTLVRANRHPQEGAHP